MLDYAHPYADKLIKLFRDTYDNPKYLYYWFSSYYYQREFPTSEWAEISRVVLDSNKEITGFLSATIDKELNQVTSLAFINFNLSKGILFGKEIENFIDLLFYKRFEKIKFKVAIGNPAERMYDALMFKYNGRIVGKFYKDEKLSDGMMYDVKHYELFREDYLASKKRLSSKHEKAMKALHDINN